MSINVYSILYSHNYSSYELHITDYFKNKFFHKSVDKSGITTILNLEKGQTEIKDDFYSKYTYDEGLNVNTDAISEYIKTNHDKSVFKLMQDGKFDEAALLNE